VSRSWLLEVGAARSNLFPTWNTQLPVAALGFAAFFGPVQEVLHLLAVFPAEAEEFGSVEVGGFRAEEGFKAPSKVGAVPRIQAVAFGRHPVVAEHLEHSVWALVRLGYSAQLYLSRVDQLVGAERCSWTSSQAGPRFSQMPV